MLTIALFATGCGLIAAPGYTSTAEDDTGPYEVTVRDQTGHVTGVEARPPEKAIVGSGAELGEDPNELIVWWVGGPCDRSPSVAVRADGEDVIIEISEDQGFGCDAVGVPRGAIIRASEQWRGGPEVLGP